MKKTFVIAFLALGIYACSKKTVASKTPTPPPPPATAQETQLSADAGDSRVKPTTLAQGKEIFTNRCGRCHALKNTENYTQAQWSNILKAMIPKARLTESEGSLVTAYVMANAKKG